MLPVICADNVVSPTMTSTSSLSVYITLVNTPPTLTAAFPSTTVYIAENVVGQAFIFTLVATDRESNPIYYNLTYVEPTSNPVFKIIPWNSNYLEYDDSYATSTPMFSYKTRPYYFIYIAAYDLYTIETSTITLTVSITYVDLPAQWISLPAIVSVPENVVTGPTELMTVSAIDPNGKG